jgi:hypothetical protein
LELCSLIATTFQAVGLVEMGRYKNMMLTSSPETATTIPEENMISIDCRVGSQMPSRNSFGIQKEAANNVCFFS